jgi:hypothetical protein
MYHNTWQFFLTNPPKKEEEKPSFLLNLCPVAYRAQLAG